MSRAQAAVAPGRRRALNRSKISKRADGDAARSHLFFHLSNTFILCRSLRTAFHHHPLGFGGPSSSIDRRPTVLFSPFHGGHHDLVGLLQGFPTIDLIITCQSCITSGNRLTIGISSSVVFGTTSRISYKVLSTTIVSVLKSIGRSEMATCSIAVSNGWILPVRDSAEMTTSHRSCRQGRTESNTIKI